MSDATMRAWRTQHYGQPLDVLKMESVPVPVPGPGQLLVKVQGIPLNLNDLERIKGGNMMVQPELPYSPGMEVLGIVDAVGEGVGADHIGRRVSAIPDGAHGGYAEYCNCPVVSAFDVPDDITLPDAAALMFPFHLAWLGLYDRARLQAGETVLIHAAAGGAGSAAIQLAKLAGATVIATVGSDAKAELCKSLGADHVINYNTRDFSAESLALTGGKGVDVVFDTVGEAVMEKSMNAIAYNGRYIMLGFASDKTVADEKFVVPRRLTLGNFSLCGVTLAYIDDAIAVGLKQGMGWNFATASLGQKIQKEIVELYRAGKIQAVVGWHIGFEDIPQAITDMAERKTVGRVVAVL
ncbi:MAG: alcohol dehydrogenase [Spongiibacteraceae bacterium]|nr:alcohol dehydrogenase [Spongiibacteraceae bacterium]